MQVEKKIAKRAKAHTIYKLANGKRVPGVTTVLGIINKPALVKWANNLGLQGIDSTTYVDGTAKIGTLAHEMIQEYLGGPAGRSPTSSVCGSGLGLSARTPHPWMVMRMSSSALTMCSAPASSVMRHALSDGSSRRTTSPPPAEIMPAREVPQALAAVLTGSVIVCTTVSNSP